ncbi:MAG: exonuclease domain-containing protein [Rhodospirillaceae bacterium]
MDDTVAPQQDTTMTPLASFRLRIALAAAAAVAIAGAAIWDAHEGAPARDALAGMFLALAGVAAAFAFVWIQVERRLVAPAAALARAARLAAAAEPAASLEETAGPLLQPMARAVETVIASRERLRDESARAVGSVTARLAGEKRRLEAILSDLAEGVVVCAPDHRIVLYNAAAARALGTPAALGLGRPVFDVLSEAPLRAALDAVSGPAPIAASATAAATGASLALRLVRIAEPGGGAAGYVITLAPDGAPAAALPPRPVFYDFGLLAPAAVPDARGSQPLDRLGYVVFDTETTGLEPRAGDEIVQIGAVRVTNGRLLDGESFMTLVNPGRPIPPRSTRFHGLTDAMVADAPTVDAAMRAFRDFAGEAALVGHNAAFDMQFLRLKEARAGVRFDAPVVDTLLLSMAIDPLEPDHSLDGLAHRFGIEVVGRHTALGDARITALVLLRLVALARDQGIVTLDDAIAATNRFVEPRQRQRPA